MSISKKTQNNINKAVETLLSVLPKRSIEVMTKRYGLGSDTSRSTLESIGQSLGITRERVRQIEKQSLDTMRASDVFESFSSIFDEFHQQMQKMGVIIPEADFLNEFGDDESLRNKVHFLLVLGAYFVQAAEDKTFINRWHVDADMANKVEAALKSLYDNLPDEDVLSESEMIDTFLSNLKDINEDYRNEEIIKRWLSLSKQIDKNALGEWGRATSHSIKVKGIRDHAYLAMKRNGSPMHFSEVADAIADIFDKDAHIATCHNELIKDSRFVLVGRGLYALKEWGYKTGVVKDVIADILKREGPLTKADLLDKVKRERYVQDNTVYVNLSQHFNKNSEGKYTI